jgi:hypothetical protein
MSSKPILCLDFDGVVHSYTSPWRAADIIPDPPTPGLVEFLDIAIEVFDVHIFSSRSHQTGAYQTGIQAMQDFIWDALYRYFFDKYGVDRFDRARTIRDALHYPTEKPPALVTLDDRAITFTGTWPDVDELRKFKPWNRK